MQPGAWLKRMHFHGVFFQGTIDRKIPSIVMGVVAMTTGFIVFCLPETRGRPLPETIADIEQTTSHRKTHIE